MKKIINKAVMAVLLLSLLLFSVGCSVSTTESLHAAVSISVDSRGVTNGRITSYTIDFASGNRSFSYSSAADDLYDGFTLNYPELLRAAWWNVTITAYDELGMPLAKDTLDEVRIKGGVRIPLDFRLEMLEGKISIAPVFEQSPDDVAEYLYLLSNGSEVKEFGHPAVEGTSLSADVPAGRWNVRVEALDSTGRLLFSGVKNIIVGGGQSVSASIDMARGNSLLNVSISPSSSDERTAYYLLSWKTPTSETYESRKVAPEDMSGIVFTSPTEGLWVFKLSALDGSGTEMAKGSGSVYVRENSAENLEITLEKLSSSVSFRFSPAVKEINGQVVSSYTVSVLDDSKMVLQEKHMRLTYPETLKFEALPSGVNHFSIAARCADTVIKRIDFDLVLEPGAGREYDLDPAQGASSIGVDAVCTGIETGYEPSWKFYAEHASTGESRFVSSSDGHAVFADLGDGIWKVRAEAYGLDGSIISTGEMSTDVIDGCGSFVYLKTTRDKGSIHFDFTPDDEISHYTVSMNGPDGEVRDEFRISGRDDYTVDFLSTGRWTSIVTAYDYSDIVVGITTVSSDVVSGRTCNTYPAFRTREAQVTVDYQGVTGNDVMQYRIGFERKDGLEKGPLYVTATEASYSISLAPGIWTVRVDALDTDNVVIGTGVSSFTSDPALENKVSVKMERLHGSAAVFFDGKVSGPESNLLERYDIRMTGADGSTAEKSVPASKAIEPAVFAGLSSGIWKMDVDAWSIDGYMIGSGTLSLRVPSGNEASGTVILNDILTDVEVNVESAEAYSASGVSQYRTVLRDAAGNEVVQKDNFSSTRISFNNLHAGTWTLLTEVGDGRWTVLGDGSISFNLDGEAAVSRTVRYERWMSSLSFSVIDAAMNPDVVSYKIRVVPPYRGTEIVEEKTDEAMSQFSYGPIYSGKWNIYVTGYGKEGAVVSSGEASIVLEKDTPGSTSISMKQTNFNGSVEITPEWKGTPDDPQIDSWKVYLAKAGNVEKGPYSFSSSKTEKHVYKGLSRGSWTIRLEACDSHGRRIGFTETPVDISTDVTSRISVSVAPSKVDLDIAPAFDGGIASTVHHWSAELTDVNGKKVSVENLGALGNKVSDLAIGTWTVTLSGHDADGNVIAGGSSDCYLIDGKENALTIPVSYYQGRVMLILGDNAVSNADIEDFLVRFSYRGDTVTTHDDLVIGRTGYEHQLLEGFKAGKWSIAVTARDAEGLVVATDSVDCVILKDGISYVSCDVPGKGTVSLSLLSEESL